MYDPQAKYVHMTATDVQLAAFGAGNAISRSRELAEEHGLASPSIGLATKLTPILSEKLKPTMVTPIAHTSEGGTSTRALSALARNRGLVFDVDGGYEAMYFALDWDHYYVRYLGSAPLIDASTGNVIAQAPCVIDARDDPNPPTYEQLYADSAMILKTKFQALADACVGRVATALFGN
jgi:hypothetical protein